MNHIFVVSGFTQKFWAKHGNGSIDVYKAMRKFASPETEVIILQWASNPRGHARRVARDYKPGDKIQLNAYSYGGGWWAMEFLAELAQVSPHIKVDVVVFCDPVLRYPWKRFWRKWQAIRTQTLLVPLNVRRVGHLYQRLSEPGGDYLVTHPTTELLYSIEVDAPHVKIDNSKEYLVATVEAAEELFG